MKFPKAISLLLLSSVEARRGSPQEIYNAAEDERDLSALMEITSCFDSHEFEVYFQGKCTFDELASRMDLMLAESGGDCLSTGELEVLSLLGLNATDIEAGRESVKQLCKAAGVVSVEGGPKGALIAFYNNEPPNVEALLQWIAQRGGAIKLRPDQKLVAIRHWDTPSKRVKGVRSIMRDLAQLVT